MVERYGMKKKIIFFPQKWKDSHYIDMMIKAYRTAGFEVRQGFISSIFLPRNKDVSFFTINSLDLLIAKQRNIILAIIVYLFIIMHLYSIKYILKKQIVWVFHDKQVHEVAGVKYSNVGNRLFKIYPNLSEFIIIHSHVSKGILVKRYGKSIKDKIIYVSHPMFIEETGKYIEKKKICNEKLFLISLGALNPYKNIPLLLDVLSEINNPNIYLTIAGGGNSEYLNYIRKKVESIDIQITLDLRRIPDEEMARFYSENHLVVLPYSLDSSLNSGAAINAFSYHRSVISSQNGTIQDMKSSNVFGYTYSSDKDQFASLKSVIEKVYCDYNGHFDDLLDLGEECYSDMVLKNSYEVVADQLKELVK